MSHTAPQETATAEVALAVGGRRLQAKLTVPAGPTRRAELLPIARSLCGTVVEVGVEDAEREGQSVSCKKGCGACCRQMVPIAEAEAREIAALVESFPEPRRTEIKRRFEDAVERLRAAGMLDAMRGRNGWPPEEVERIGLDYFRLGIPCPFLEDESCSIHPDRPLACREYLVTSPAEYCAQQEPGKVKGVPIPADVSHAVRAADRGSSAVGWVPLLLSLDWAEAHPEPPVTQTGPALVQQVFAKLTGQTPPGV